MREHYLEAFDAIRIDCLNGDVRKGGRTPDGKPDPSVFTVPGNLVGIQVGTAITTLVRKSDHAPTKTVGFRHLWGQTKREELTATSQAEPDELYDDLSLVLPLGLPFVKTAVSDGWHGWPSLPDLFPVSFPGVKTSRDSLVVDIDLDILRARISNFLASNETERRGPTGDAFIPYTYRPFDTRWLYWEADSKLLDRPRPDYRPHVFKGNMWLEARQC